MKPTQYQEGIRRFFVSPRRGRPISRVTIVVAALLAALSYPVAARAEVTVFTYQGSLNTANGPANGLYDFTFSIYDLPTGSGLFAIQTNLATQVSNGLFTVTVDFGPVVTEGIFSGPSRWLEIAARTNGAAVYSTLTPRQPLTASPYAITAANLVSGGLAAGTYGSAFTFNNPANSFSGNGGGLTNINAVTLGGFSYCALPCYWNLGGNAGTSPLSDFVGTTDAQPLDLRVNNTSALELVPGSSLPNVVGGRGAIRPSVLATGVSGVVIAGGNAPSGLFTGFGAGDFMAAFDDDGTIGGGFGNKVGTDNGDPTDAAFATVGGGIFNSAGNFAATVAGGSANTASGASSVVAGGNVNTAAADYSNIGGGANNAANAPYSVIGGGNSNYVALGQYSLVGGGSLNTNLATYAVIAGGINNRVLALGNNGFVGGGVNNTASSGNTVVAGGANNIVDANAAAVGGGSENHAGGDHSYVAGGQGNAGSAAYTFIGGGANNQAHGFGAVVGGGGFDGVLTAGNSAFGPAAVVSGGLQNNAQNSYTTVGGGIGNGSLGFAATVGGGWSNVAVGQLSTIAGGSSNTTAGAYCTVPGGFSNLASGEYSFAAGQQARAVNVGSFVWADSQPGPFLSTSNDAFCVRARGGIQLSTNTSVFCGTQTRQMLNLWGTSYGIGVQNLTTYFRCDNSGSLLNGFSWFKGGVHNDGINNPGGGVELMRLTSTGLLVNGTFVSASDRNAKEHFAPVDSREVLEKVLALPVTEWNYKADPTSRHLGPMAQDFYAAFGVGPDDKHITTVDEGGVALAAIQGLNQKVEQQQAQIESLKEQNLSLENRLAQLETLLRQAISRR